MSQKPFAIGDLDAEQICSKYEDGYFIAWFEAHPEIIGIGQTALAAAYGLGQMINMTYGAVLDGNHAMYYLPDHEMENREARKKQVAESATLLLTGKNFTKLCRRYPHECS